MVWDGLTGSMVIPSLPCGMGESTGKEISSNLFLGAPASRRHRQNSPAGRQRSQVYEIGPRFGPCVCQITTEALNISFAITPSDTFVTAPVIWMA
jgi:hypothetical protein